MITRLPLAALIIASLFWGTAVSVTKYALCGFGPITLLAISLIAGTAVLWTIVILRGHCPPPPWRRAVLLAARLKDAVDLNTVCDDLARVVQTALEPAHVSVWTSPRR
jgi:EamA-like transporter family